MTNDRFSNHFGGNSRKPEENIFEREINLASSIQSVTEETVKNGCFSQGRNRKEESLSMSCIELCGKWQASSFQNF